MEFLPRPSSRAQETLTRTGPTFRGQAKAAKHTLQQAVEGWLAEHNGERGLKRSTIADYEDMFERLYRDLGADTPVRTLADGRLRAYFADFKSYRVLSEKKAREARAEGKNVQQLTIERWTAQPADSQAVEVATKEEAVRIADELPGTWKHQRRGAYRVVPLGCPAPSPCVAGHSDGPPSGRLDRQAAEDEALDAVFLSVFAACADDTYCKSHFGLTLTGVPSGRMNEMSIPSRIALAMFASWPSVRL